MCFLLILSRLGSHTYDAYGLGLLIHSLFNPAHPLPSNSATTPPSRGSIPSPLFALFKRLLNPSTKARLTPKAFLEAGSSPGGFFNTNRLIKVCIGLADFALAGEGEKNELLRCVLFWPSTFSLTVLQNFKRFFGVFPSLFHFIPHTSFTPYSIATCWCSGTNDASFDSSSGRQSSTIRL